MRSLAFFLMVSVAPVLAQARPQSACPPIVAPRPTVVPPQSYRSGSLVPPYLLDEPLQWLECPAPEFPSGADRAMKKRTFLYVTVDERGAVVDVKPRGPVDPEGFFDAAIAAVRQWRSSAPRWKAQAVRSGFAVDIVFDAAAPLAPEPPAASAPTAAAPAPEASAPKPPVPAQPEPERTTATDVAAPPKPAETATPAAPPASTPRDPAPTSPPSPAQLEGAPQPPAQVEKPPVTAAPPAPSLPPAAPAPSQPAAATPAPTQPPAAELQPAPAEKPVEPARPCPSFFVLPSTDQPPAYRAGDLVPNAYLDTRPAWVECPWPDFNGVTGRAAALIVVLDDKGMVREVRPRGQAASAPVFQRARAAVQGWRVSPPPRYKGLPVWTSTSLDLRNDVPAAPPATPTPAAAPAVQGTVPGAEETPFVVDYYYKVKWGFADEFWRLFLKNHWPVLRKQMETGRILDVRASKPVYHASEEARWDYRVTITFRSTAAAFASVDTAALERQLFPDQENFRREEQRRFEILLAHWDVPVQPVKLDK